MEKISLIVMVISAVIFIITALVFCDKQQLKGYNFHPLKELLGIWINADVKSRISRIIIRCSWGIWLLSLGCFIASLCVRLEGTVVATAVITGFVVCIGVFAIDFITSMVYCLTKLAARILYWIYKVVCWFAGK